MADADNSIVWNEQRENWCCDKCGSTQFQQTVIAQNYVTLSSGDASTLVESDDFEGSWEVTDRADVVCAGCGTSLKLPDSAEIVENCEWEERQ